MMPLCPHTHTSILSIHRMGGVNIQTLQAPEVLNTHFLFFICISQFISVFCENLLGADAENKLTQRGFHGIQGRQERPMEDDDVSLSITTSQFSMMSGLFWVTRLYAMQSL